MKKTIKTWICESECAWHEDRLAKLEKFGSPKIILEREREIIAELKHGILEIGGDKELINKQFKKAEWKKGRGGVPYVVVNGNINYFPNAKYGRFIKKVEEN